MSALAEKIKRLAMSTDFYNEVVEILLELEARQPNYTIQILPAPAEPFPTAGPSSPYTVPYPAPNPWYPQPSFPRVGDPPNYPLGGGGTLCYASRSTVNHTNGPEPQSDPTGYVDPTSSNPTGVVKYDRDVVKSLERKIEENGTNKFVSSKIGYGG